jgi:molybdenum cofactor synthesis domain-containing protein
MGIAITGIISGLENLQTVALQPDMKVFFSEYEITTNPDFDIYPKIQITCEEPFNGKVLDHLWIDEKRCLEICGYDQQRKIFTGRAVTPMSLKVGGSFEHIRRIFRATVITLSDRASRGEYDDLSGKMLRDKIISYFNQIDYPVSVEYELIGDDTKLLTRLLEDQFNSSVDFVFTTGGTGIGPRDITVPIVKKMIDFELPGIMDLIRVKYGLQNPAAVLSRSIAGVKDKKMIFCLPGSVKAVREYFSEIEKVLLHAAYMIYNIDKH